VTPLIKLDSALAFATAENAATRGLVEVVVLLVELVKDDITDLVEKLSEVIIFSIFFTLFYFLNIPINDVIYISPNVDFVTMFSKSDKSDII